MASLFAWETALPIIRAAATVPVTEANVDLATPDTEHWLSIDGRAGDAGPAELGPLPLWTEEGALEVTLFSRIGQGTLVARQQADRIMSAFRTTAPPPGLEWTGWALDEGRTSEDGTHFALMLTIRYRLTTAVNP
ncbi:MAG TPA: phage tail terminator-like protein [Roseococcus sp.]|jgi:hypothetical protein|nr:phage tail terminator-like protein [Roseococcus sp.]